MTLKFSNGLLERLMPPGQLVRPQALSASSPAMRLVNSYLDSFEPIASSADAVLLETFGTHICDLVALAIGASGETLELIGGRGLKAARTDAVLKVISRSFTRPDYSAEHAGRDLGLSARQVHRLLEETPKTFYEHVLECRLQRAYRLLTDPACDRLSVAEIAQQTGFTNVKHFSRTFRVRFGDAPTGVRGSIERT